MLRRGWTRLYDHMDQKEIFKTCDRDGNGKLDRSEVEAVLEKMILAMGEPSPKTLLNAYMDRIITQADHDHDQMISFEEFADMQRELRVILRERRSF